MIVQAKTKRLSEAFKKRKTVKERNKLMLQSGEESAVLMFNRDTMKEFYRPAIGRFIIHGLTEDDFFEYDTIEEASKKGKELRKLIEAELKE